MSSGLFFLWGNGIGETTFPKVAREHFPWMMGGG